MRVFVPSASHDSHVPYPMEEHIAPDVYIYIYILPGVDDKLEDDDITKHINTPTGSYPTQQQPHQHNVKVLSTHQGPPPEIQD